MRQNKETAEAKRTKKVLGITGGVGAGKSLVLDYIKGKYGARVIQADLVGHTVQEPGQDCYGRIVDRFGTEILLPGGQINRNALAALVFGNPQLLEELNRLVHPAVKACILSEIAQERQNGVAPFLVVEAALLLEAGYDSFCDEVWYLYASPETRQARLTQTRGYTTEKIGRIMSSQMRDREFRRRCDAVIENNGTIESLYKQLDIRLSNFLSGYD